MRAKEFVTEKKKRKKHRSKHAAYGPGPYGWYGFHPGYSGEYDSGDSGGDGGGMEEAWSQKYKRSINCSNPKGFSQRAHCQGRKKTEDVEQDPGDPIPFPAGTTSVDVSDPYDWYKLGMVISDLDDANPQAFGRGGPSTVIAFGSEDEEHRLLPYLKRLGLKLQDIDKPSDTRKIVPAKAVLDKLEEGVRLDELNINQTLDFIKKAHGDQLYGKLPYWRHPRAVAMTGKKIFGNKFNSDAVKVAFLHDVVEDTHIGLDELSQMDFSPQVIEAVGLLTKNKALTYRQNIENIINSGNPLAMMVKYADNYENFSGEKSSWDPARAASSQKKYLMSLNMLGDRLGVKHHIGENFADGRNPQDKGDSRRLGIPKKASLSSLDKIGKGSGRKAQLARWQANMRRGRAKK